MSDESTKRRLHRAHAKTVEVMSAWGCVVPIKQPFAVDYYSPIIDALVRVCLDEMTDADRKALEKFKASANGRHVYAHIYAKGADLPWPVEIFAPGKSW